MSDGLIIDVVPTTRKIELKRTGNTATDAAIIIQEGVHTQQKPMQPRDQAAALRDAQPLLKAADHAARCIEAACRASG